MQAIKSDASIAEIAAAIREAGPDRLCALDTLVKRGIQTHREEYIDLAIEMGWPLPPDEAYELVKHGHAWVVERAFANNSRAWTEIVVEAEDDHRPDLATFALRHVDKIATEDAYYLMLLALRSGYPPFIRAVIGRIDLDEFGRFVGTGVMNDMLMRANRMIV
jgi:hypothetical protein